MARSKGKQVIAARTLPRRTATWFKQIASNRAWFIGNVLGFKRIPADWNSKVRSATSQCPGLTVEVLQEAWAVMDKTNLPEPLRLLALSFKDAEAFQQECIARRPVARGRGRLKLREIGSSRSGNAVRVSPQMADRCRYCQGSLPPNPVRVNDHPIRGVCARCISKAPVPPKKEPRERRARGKSVWARVTGWNPDSTRRRHK